MEGMEERSERIEQRRETRVQRITVRSMYFRSVGGCGNRWKQVEKKWDSKRPFLFVLFAFVILLLLCEYVCFTNLLKSSRSRGVYLPNK